ncbi:hypothetical protein E4U12_007527 [Claviceps purpurea]|nr:hypothetical protein E4U12_007527 [Claviceps purpurea]
MGGGLCGPGGPGTPLAAMEAHVVPPEPRRSAPSSNIITIENLDQSVEQAIQKALRAPLKGRTLDSLFD